TGIGTEHRRVVDAHLARGGARARGGGRAGEELEGKSVRLRSALREFADVGVWLPGRQLHRARQCTYIGRGLIIALDRVPEPGLNAEPGKSDQYGKRECHE